MAENNLEVPVFPAVAQQIAQAADTDADGKALAELVRKDAPVSAHLLRLANSPVYRGRQTIVTVQHAIARLGRDKLRQIALVVALKSRTFRVPGFDEELQLIVRHGFATAVFAQAIARGRAGNAEEAFLCGLLHDLGKLVLLQAALDAGASARLEILRVVDELHAAAGAGIAKAWGLSANVALAMAQHHGSDVDAPAAVHIVRLADTLAHCALDDVDDRAVRTHPSLAPLELYPNQLDMLLFMKASVRATAGEVLS
ncbi:MAG TPA: HDOD domain-containing protein [Myxococcota bacterium]